MEIIGWLVGWLVDKTESSTHKTLEQNHEVWGDIRIGLLRHGLKIKLQMCCHNVAT